MVAVDGNDMQVKSVQDLNIPFGIIVGPSGTLIVVRRVFSKASSPNVLIVLGSVTDFNL